MRSNRIINTLKGRSFDPLVFIWFSQILRRSCGTWGHRSKCRFIIRLWVWWTSHLIWTVAGIYHIEPFRKLAWSFLRGIYLLYLLLSKHNFLRCLSHNSLSILLLSFFLCLPIIVLSHSFLWSLHYLFIFFSFILYNLFDWFHNDRKELIWFYITVPCIRNYRELRLDIYLLPYESYYTSCLSRYGRNISLPLSINSSYIFSLVLRFFYDKKWFFLFHYYSATVELSETYA